ncbi:MAG: DUF4390 domain-containing protein [Pseudomonadota bacterium]|nr:DUF4390 domain-containing protein [Pseudomonadota bacterium]
MTAPPPPGPLCRRSVLRAALVAASRAALPSSLGTALLLPMVPALAAGDPELGGFEVARDEDGLFLSFAANFELGKAVDDALTKSVPLFFVAEADVFRDRWYWSDRRVAHAVRVWKIVFQPLTSTYRVTTVGGLSQTYPTRAEALAAVSRASRWRIAEPGQLDDGGRHYLEFSWRLDITLLPRPMQIVIGPLPEWQLAVRRTQRIN